MQLKAGKANRGKEKRNEEKVKDKEGEKSWE